MRRGGDAKGLVGRSEKLRLYVAGPISGYDIEERKKAFKEAARNIKLLGHIPVFPFDIDNWHGDANIQKLDELGQGGQKNWHFFMRKDVRIALTVDGIALLPNWEDSVGSNGELIMIRDLFGGRAFRYLPPMLGFPGTLPRLVELRSDEGPSLVKDIRERNKQRIEKLHSGAIIRSEIGELENPKDREGTKKIPLQLIPPIASALEALVMGHGAAKYGPWNWREKRISASEYVAAVKRHVDQYWDGEDLDVGTPEKPGSLLPHLAHARATLGVLMDAIGIGMVHDDRPKNGGAAARLIREHTKS
jgi:hypothetical protein